MSKNLAYMVIILVFILSGCEFTKTIPTAKGALKLPDLPEENGKIWLEIDPKQCGSNPWERDWKQIDNTVPAKCQSACAPAGKQADWVCQTKCLVQEYYSRKEVEIFDAKAISYEEKFGKNIPVCLACDCPGGETLYVQIPISKTSAMLEMGYRQIVRSCDAATPPPYGCD